MIAARTAKSRPFHPLITSPALPGAMFESSAALLDSYQTAMEIESVISAFEQDGDEFALSVDLTELGFESYEIAAIVANPQVRLTTIYAVA